MIGHLLREWDEYAHDRPLPDVGRIAGLLEKAMTRPENRAEDHPGLIEATKFLWRAWATDRPGRVPIDRAAVTAIAAELATPFRVARGESERRVTTILREWDKRPDSDMPGRASGNRYADGVRVSYVRYSDDILLVLPVPVDQATAIMDSLPSRIRAHGDELLIKPEKSSLVRYTREDSGEQSCELIAGKGRNGLEYLGFRYDGRSVFLRDSTMSNLHRKVASVARNQAEATIKRYPGKTYAELCGMFNFEDFTKRFGRVEGFEPTSTSKKWTFWTYVVRSVDEFGPAGRKILGQVKRLRRRARHRVDEEIARAMARKAKQDAAP